MRQESAVPRTSNESLHVDGPKWKRTEAAGWRCALELDEKRSRSAGSETELVNAIRSGADLRVGTAFRHHEHIDLNSTCRDLIQEFVDFRVTYLLDNRWIAGICNLRMPVRPPDEFGPRESMSFFMYNQDGQQAIARPYLDRRLPADAFTAFGQGLVGRSEFADMPGYSELDRWDDDTNAPSTNFIYEFDYYRYNVHDRWCEVLSHDDTGAIQSGSLEELVAAFRTGCELKVAIRGLCLDLCEDRHSALDHEVFIHLGSCYYYTQRKLFLGTTHPTVRVTPAIPLVYRSRQWDFGWLLPRTDGHMARWLCDPYTLTFHKSVSRHGMRWFVGT